MTVIVLRENGHLFVRPFLPPSSNSLVAVDTAGELPSPSLVVRLSGNTIIRQASGRAERAAVAGQVEE